MKHSVMTAEGTLSFEAVMRNGAPMVELTAKAKKFPLPISIVVTPEQAQAAHSGLGFVLEDVIGLQIAVVAAGG